MRGNRGQDTKPERALRSKLHRSGLRFRKHTAPLKGLRCRADVVFLRERVAVFVDGCFWHRCPVHGNVPQDTNGYWAAKLEHNVARDRRNDHALKSAGWVVLRVWEHENPEAAARHVRAVLTSRRNELGLE